MEKETEIHKLLTNPSGWRSLLTFSVLLLAAVVGFSSRLFAVIRFESIIHEFDPWFNYRATRHMVENGFYNFLNWFDERAWYPLGRIVGGTVYPGLMVTSGMLHYILNALHISVHIREICVFLAPVFSGLTATATYFLTKELWSPGAGLFAACFMAIVPGYISRSVAGSYDNEGIAIFALQFTYFLWLKSVKSGSIFWAALCALSYFYMVSAWGGYVFIINLIPLHALVLILMGRYSSRIYVAYSIFYIVGLILSMQIPFVGFQPIRTSEHMAAAGVFGLLQAYAFLKYLQSMMSKKEFQYFFFASILLVTVVGFVGIVALTYAGYIAPWSGRFYSLWDTGYAKIHIPIIASVSEHQPTTWVSFFFDLHILAAVFPAGVWYCIKNINDERVFVVLYAITAVYFAGVMVRLMLTLTPVVCVLAGIVFSKTYEKYLRDEVSSVGVSPTENAVTSASTLVNNDSSTATPIVKNLTNRKTGGGGGVNSAAQDENESDSSNRNLYDKAGKLKKPHRLDGSDGQKEKDGVGLNVKSIVSITLVMILLMFVVHCTWVTSNAYSSPSIVLASYHSDGSRSILDDFREAYYWLRKNTDDKARVMSWWDYGYQIAGMGNKTTLVDNNTWNNSHIALVGKAMSSNETEAYKIMRMLDVDYVLVIFGGFIGYSGDDINKFLWMVRIAEGEHPKDIKESDYFTEQGEFRVDAGGSKTLLNCLMYKMSYYRFGELKLDYRMPSGYDRTRNAEIGHKNFDLNHLEEAFTSEHWLVRIFRVKKLENRAKISHQERKVRYAKKTPKKGGGKGSIGNKQLITKIGRRKTAK